MEVERRASKRWIMHVVLVLIVMCLLGGCMSLLIPRGRNYDYIKVTNAKELFTVINDTLYKFEEELHIQTSSYNDFMNMWNELDGQFALHSAFREKDVKISYMEKGGVCKTDIQMKLNSCGQAMQYLYAKNVKKYPTKEAEEVGEALLEVRDSIITDTMTEEEKVKKIHNYLITHCEYALDGDVTYYSNTFVLLTEGKAQCQGYSEAFAALCLLSGIQCRVISGNSTFAYGDGAHAWCQVNVGYIWYHVDVTWDDPIPDSANMVRYDFYLKGDMTMDLTHDWSEYYEPCYIDYVL